MSTEIATTEKIAVAEWVKVFPKQASETYTGSVTFMKQLTVIAVSTITYLKNVFPEENYTNESFAGLNLTILKKKCKDELAQFVSTSLLQASDAFEKKYLHQLALCFYSGECRPENLVEYYMFEYSYSDDSASMNVASKTRGRLAAGPNSHAFTFQNIKNQTVNLIRACMVNTSYNTQLPECTEISLRLYYNDDAPAEYQAPGFVCPLEPRDHLAGTSGARLTLGTVETRFHRLVMYTKDIANSYDVNPTQNPPELPEHEMDFEGIMEEGSASAPTPAPVMRCPCNKNDADDTCAILICDYCGCGGHSVCYGVYGACAGHCCDRCADADPARRPTDHRFNQLNPNKRESLCIFRRALWLCRENEEMSAPALAHRFQLSNFNACKVMKLLRKHNVILTGDDDELIVSPRKVIHKQLQQAMEKVFQKDDIVERLLAETLPKENDADPVGDVLEPMEKINLRNATTLGQIIEPIPPKRVTENSTLQQYREVILSNEIIEEELPLSGNHNPVKDMARIGKKITKRKSDEDKKSRVALKTKKTKTDAK